MNNCFHSLRTGGKAGAIRFAPAGDVPSAYSLLRGDVIPSSPVELRWESGRRLCDLVETSLFFVVLVSERLVDCLTDAGATGWRLYDVAPSDRAGRAIRGYRGLSVVGRTGPVDWQRTRPVDKGSFVLEDARVGLFIDEATWDGSDVFMPIDSGHIVVTEKVREAVMRNGISNITVTPCEQVILPI
jgi:hypothetical protein